MKQLFMLWFISGVRAVRDAAFAYLLDPTTASVG